MSNNLIFAQSVVKNSQKFLSILYRSDSLAMLRSDKNERRLNAGSSTHEYLGIYKKTYYMALKQSVTAAIIQSLQLYKNEILLAIKYTIERVINVKLHKVRDGIKARVIADKLLNENFFDHHVII